MIKRSPLFRSPLSQLIALLIIIAITLFIIFNVDNFSNSLACSKLEDFKKREIRNIFIKKYIDGGNHNALKIILGHNEEIIVPRVRDSSSFYNFTRSGDSIVKEIATDTIKVYRQGQIYSFKMYFACDSQ